MRFCCKFLSVLLLLSAWAGAQAPERLVSTGRAQVNGVSVPYTIRHLPVSSFPQLPMTVAAELTQRGCAIPQTYEARRPENVIHASLERAGSSDWAVLCSVEGKVSLLVFFGSGGGPLTLATMDEKSRLQRMEGSAELGFNWGIDPASPERVRQAQSGMEPRPARLSHDALADSTVDHGAVYRYFDQGKWTVVPLPD